MNAIDVFYQIKPAIPRRLQISVRRVLAARKRRATADIWPIDPAAARTPRDWTGWPDKKKFALVLQHDVDTSKGLSRCLKLVELERQMGFRSSFNFVPEDYPTPFRMVQALSQAGFEIGVHG
ncbi:MAG TPA: hypothetical protein VKT17_08890, partial [Acidobacteriota bacterium]|nr:hypothetical protein [Acidobacteriota bacterium]